MKPTLLTTIALIAVLFILSNTTNAATYYWTGSTNSNWSNAANWAMSSCGGATATSTPGSGDSAVFSGSCTASCTIDVSINVLSLRTDNTYSGTITQGSGNTVTIAYCKFADGTFSGSSAAITISTSLIIEGGAFTTTSGTTTVEGNFSYTGGTFYPNNGRVVFYKTLTVSGVNSSSYINLYDAEFQAMAGNSTITLSNIYFNVADSTLLTGSNQLFINASQTTSVINVSGEVKIYNTSSTGGGDGTIIMNGSAMQYLVNTSSTDDEGKLPNLTIDNTSGTVYLIGDITMGGSTTLTYTAGTINAGTSTVVFYYDNTITGSMTFNNIEFQGTNSTCVVSNTITVNGKVSVTGTGTIAINTGTIDLYGSLYISNADGNPNSATLNFVGTANDSIDVSSSVGVRAYYLPAVTINKTGGDLYLIGIISLYDNWTNNYSTANINPTSCTFYLNNNLTIGGTYSTPVWNLQFGSTGEYTYTLTEDSALIVKNNLTISGNNNIFIDGYTINIYGNIVASNTGGGDYDGTASFNLVGSQNDSIISPSGYTAGDCYIPSITINKTSGTLYLSGIISILGNWTNNYSTTNINSGTSTLYFNGYYGLSIGGTYSTPTWDIELTSYENPFTLTEDSALIVRNNLTLKGSGNTTTNGYTINIYGNIIASSTGGGDYDGSSVFNLVGSQVDSIISPSGYTLGECDLPPITINKTSGTLYLIGNITEDGNWTYNSGTVNAGTSSVVFYGTHSITASQMSSYMSFNNLQIGGSGADITLASILNVEGRLTINGTLNTSSSNYQILVGNSWVNNGTYTGNNSNVTFNGSVNDSIKGSDNTSFYSLTMNQTGTVTLSDPVTVTNALTLTNGDILSSSTNLLTLNNGSSVSGANDNSFVNGPIKKVGNSAFTFPTGAGSSYHAIGISAPSSTSDAFTAQYYNTAQTEGSSTDDSLTYVSACDYWNLTHPAGSSDVTVTLYWGTGSCDIKRLSSLRVGYWNGSEWTNLGQSANTGTPTSGSVTAATTSTAYGYFAISKHSPSATVNASANTTICYGTSATISSSPSGGFSPYTYSWSPATALSSSTASNPTATPTITTTYTVTVNDDDNAPTATGTVVVTVDSQLIANAGGNKTLYSGRNTFLGANPTASGGTPIYTYNWVNQTDSVISTQADPLVSPTTATTYIIAITDTLGCTATDTSIINLYDDTVTSSNFIELLNLTYSDLNSYQQGIYDTLIGNSDVDTIYFVHVGTFTDTAYHGVLTINLPFLPHSSIQYSGTTFAYTSENDYRWFGNLVDTTTYIPDTASDYASDTTSYSVDTSAYSSGTFTVIAINGAKYGELGIGNEDYYIRDLSGGIQAMIKKLPPPVGSNCGSSGIGPDSSTLATLESDASTEESSNSCLDYNLRILVLYSNGAENSGYNPSAIAYMGLTQMQGIFINSQLFNNGVQNFTIVNVLPDNSFTESYSVRMDAQYVANSSYVQALRAQYYADVVVMLSDGTCPNYTPTSGSCPSDYSSGAFYGYTASVGPIQDSAYSIVQINNAANSTVFTFAHEIGHQFGARHERSDGCGGSCSDYAHAHELTVVPWYAFNIRNYHTVMQGGTNYGGNVISFYSNLNVKFEGVNTGASDDDNAIKINNTEPIVTSWYPKPIGFNVSVTGSVVYPCGLTLSADASANCGSGYYTYQWYESINGGNYTPISGATSSSVTTGSYASSWSDTYQLLQVQVKDTKSGKVAVGNYGITIPICPAGGRGHEAMISSSINNVIQNSNGSVFSIYPNPNNGNFTLNVVNNGSLSENLTYEIYNIIGQKLFVIDNATLTQGQNSYPLNMQNFSSGYYLLKAKTLNFNTVIPFTIQH